MIQRRSLLAALLLAPFSFVGAGRKALRAGGGRTLTPWHFAHWKRRGRERDELLEPQPYQPRVVWMTREQASQHENETLYFPANGGVWAIGRTGEPRLVITAETKV